MKTTLDIADPLLRDAGVGGSGPTSEFSNAKPDRWLEAMYGGPDAPDRD